MKVETSLNRIVLIPETSLEREVLAIWRSRHASISSYTSNSFGVIDLTIVFKEEAANV